MYISEQMAQKTIYGRHKTILYLCCVRTVALNLYEFIREGIVSYLHTRLQKPYHVFHILHHLGLLSHYWKASGTHMVVPSIRQ